MKQCVSRISFKLRKFSIFANNSTLCRHKGQRKTMQHSRYIILHLITKSIDIARSCVVNCLIVEILYALSFSEMIRQSTGLSTIIVEQIMDSLNMHHRIRTPFLTLRTPSPVDVVAAFAGIENPTIIHTMIITGKHLRRQSRRPNLSEQRLRINNFAADRICKHFYQTSSFICRCVRSLHIC